VIEIRGFKDGGEPLRTDFLDFTLVDDTPPPPPAPEPFRVETEAFTVEQGFVVGNLGDASGGKVLFAGGSGEQIASYIFTAASGVYDLDLGYFDENDGAAALSVFVNNSQIDSFVWDQNLGSALANAATRAVRAIDGVTLQTNDVIEIRGFKDGGEPLRTDFLDFTYVDDLMM